MEDAVILVDKNDNELGTMPKLEAHIVGALHRAFSIFIFNSKKAITYSTTCNIQIPLRWFMGKYML
ncbi:putative Isopentenyl-diphosphate Delta-isomerase 1 [Proteus penneri ATCC 35198]|nr:putative Isopentenyl-diphosphate Delta-isomerase 1 [Proteus penneri ATCC 35198]